MNRTILPEFMLPGGNIDMLQNTCTIGLLDIFGFEKFVLNKFEQLCINYVNEKLHKLYIHAIFDAEKIELKAQGLEDRIDSLKEPDDTAPRVINILDKKQLLSEKDGKIGIFNLVDDCSTQDPRPDYKTLMDRIKKNHKDNNKFALKSNRPDEKFFTIKHSAKDVTYSAESFIDKNVDKLSASLEKVLTEKTTPQIGMIYRNFVPNLDEEEEEKAN
jgi:myosin heavy subunit